MSDEHKDYIPNWVENVEKSSRKIWLAGLGAYSNISNDGDEIFDKLVSDGEKAEEHLKSEFGKSYESITHSAAVAAKSKVELVKDKALNAWSEVEQLVDRQIKNAKTKFSSKSQEEIELLHKKIDSLTDELNKISEKLEKDK